MKHPDATDRGRAAVREFLTIIGIDPATVKEVAEPAGPGPWRMLHPVGRDERGRPLYRLGDARRLHDQDILKQQAKENAA